MRLVKVLSKGEGIRTLLWTFIKSFQVNWVITKIAIKVTGNNVMNCRAGLDFYQVENLSYSSPHNNDACLWMCWPSGHPHVFILWCSLTAWIIAYIFSYIWPVSLWTRIVIWAIYTMLNRNPVIMVYLPCNAVSFRWRLWVSAGVALSSLSVETTTIIKPVTATTE